RLMGLVVGGARSSIDPGEPVMAEGGLRAHSAFGGKRQRLSLVAFGALDVRPVGTRRDLAERAERPRLEAALTALASEREGLLTEDPRVIVTPGERIRLGKIGHDERVEVHQPRRLVEADGLFEQRETVDSPTANDVRMTHDSSSDRRGKWKIPRTRQRERTFADLRGLFQLLPAGVEVQEAPAGNDQAVGVVHRLGETDALMAVGEGRLELSALGMDPRQISPGHHRRQPNQPVAIAAEITTEALHGLSKKVEGRFVVAREVARGSLVKGSPNPDRQISQRLAELPGALAVVASLVRTPRHVEDMAHVRRELADAAMVVERPGQRVCLLQIGQDPQHLPQW